LVEVILALGIVTFGMIPVFGLLPVGMNSFRNSMNTTICVQIGQRVVNDLQQTDFDEIQPSLAAGSLRYFDVQGNELATANDPSVAYHVNLAFSNSTSLPGSTGMNPYLGTVIVQVVNNPGNRPLARGAGGLWTDQNLEIFTYSSKLARVN
jgi:uncharacterized protein (TIGR02598 family)